MIWLWLWCALASARPLVLWHAYDGGEEKALKQAMTAWTAESGTAVELVAVPFGTYDSKLETAIPRGNGPDLFIAGHGSLGKWTRMDLVQPAEPTASGYRDRMVDAVSLNDRAWGHPLAFKTLILLYDPTRIDAPPTTVSELVELAKEHTVDGGYGLAYQATEPFSHVMWLHAYGAATIRDGEPVLDHPGHARALALSRHLAVDAGIMPPQPTAELVSRLYENGQAAFVISGPWFASGVERPIAAAPLPIVDEVGKPAQPFLVVEAAFVAQHAKDPTGALDAARFLAEDERGLAPRAGIGKQAVAWNRPHVSDMQRTLQIQAQSAVIQPTDPRILPLYEAQARALRRVLRGAVTPEEGAAEIGLVFDILARPAPPAVSPWPYVCIMALALLGSLGWLLVPLRQASYRESLWKHRWDYVWVAPAGVAMTLLVAVPFITGAAVSLFAHSVDSGWSFVGFAHFLDILLARDWPVTSPVSFLFTLVVTVLWTVANLVLHVGIGVMLALVLREPWIRMRGVWRALLIIPWAVPNYITALIWRGMFHAQYGAINALIGLVAFQDGPVAIDWFGSFATSFAANLTTNTWLGFPFMMVVTLGALQSIPRDLEDAAEMDGAGWWFRLRHVIWPLLAPALMPAVILGSVWTFNMFNVIYLVSAGEPDSSTEILISEAYRWAFTRGNRYGYAAAYGVLIFGVLLVYSRLANRLVGRRVL
jgi:arabinogalactan oligomer / maltooligosaccharide transport system permease protein